MDVTGLPRTALKRLAMLRRKHYFPIFVALKNLRSYSLDYKNVQIYFSFFFFFFQSIERLLCVDSFISSENCSFSSLIKKYFKARMIVRKSPHRFGSKIRCYTKSLRQLTTRMPLTSHPLEEFLKVFPKFCFIQINGSGSLKHLS